MGSGLSALIVGLQPVLTAIWLSGTGSRITRRQWLGLVLGFAGLLLVVSRKLEAGGPGDQADAVNLALAVLALPCIALIARLLFDEPITALTLAGIALTAFGVSLVVRAGR